MTGRCEGLWGVKISDLGTLFRLEIFWEIFLGRKTLIGTVFRVEKSVP